MTSNEYLLKAIGEIDEELIAGADSYKGRGVPIRRYLSLAACLFIVVTAVLFMARNILPKFDVGLGGSAAPGSPDKEFTNGAGETMIYKDFGDAMVIPSADGLHFTAYMTLYESVERMDLIFRGEGYDEYEEPIFIISTTADLAELTHVPVEPPRITVNGADATALPSEAGNYTVTIDVSHLTEAGYSLDGYFVLGAFGRVDIKK